MLAWLKGVKYILLPTAAASVNRNLPPAGTVTPVAVITLKVSVVVSSTPTLASVSGVKYTLLPTATAP
jgi:hypothetical protein